MFERYTEKARRTIFFARYEASQFGSPYIETEHLLIGLLREDKTLGIRFLKEAQVDPVRVQITANTPIKPRVSTTTDLPLSNECKRVLKEAADEADRMKHRHIGTGHLFVALLQEKDSAAEVYLREKGVTLESAREIVASSEPDSSRSRPNQILAKLSAPSIVLHGEECSAKEVLRRVALCRQFHWEKKPWGPTDIVTRRGQGTFSFDLTLAGKSPEMELVKGGWKKDECAVCLWVLSDQLGPEHASGYTNGRDWVCEECYEKFWARPDFFGGAFGDLT